MRGFKEGLLNGVLAAALVAGAGLPAAAQGRGPISIPASDLPQAAAALTAATGTQVLWQGAGDTARTRPVTGAASAEAALDAMLAGTGLGWRRSSAGSVEILRLPRPATGGAGGDAIEIPQVDVTGTAGPPPTGTIGQPPPAYAGGQVATGGRLGLLGNRSTFDIPFSQNNYTEQLLRDRQARSLSDAVQDDPAVRIINPRFSERDEFFIRGFSILSGDVAFDGLFGIADPRRTFVGSLERVEILRGPSALLNGGTGRVGGTINLIPKRAFDEPLNRVTLGYASRSRRSVDVDLGRRFGDANEWGIRFNGGYIAGDTPVDLAREETSNFALALDYRGERLRFSTDLGYRRSNYQSIPGLFSTVAAGVAIPSAPDGRRNTAFSFEFLNNEHRYATSRIEYDLTPDVTLFAAGGLSRYEEEQLTGSPIITANNGSVRRTLAIAPTAVEGYTYEVGGRARATIGPLRHQFALSFSEQDGKNFSRGYVQPSFPAFNTNIYSPLRLPGSTISSAGFPSVDSQPLFTRSLLRSVGVADTISTPDETVALTLGGRWQSVVSRSYVTAPVPTRGQRSSEYDEGRFSPAIGLAVKPWREWTIYGNYVEALTQGPTAPTTALNANEVFAPVVSDQYEVGTRYDFGRMVLSAAVFQITQPSGFTDPATRRFGVDGEQRNRGLELSFFGAPTDDLRLIGGITFLDGKLTETAGGQFNGKTVPGVPRTQINLGAEYDLPFLSGLTAIGRVVHTTRQFYDQGNTQSIPTWTRLDVGARYRFDIGRTPFTARLNIENVADRNYWQSTGRGYLIQGAPRTYLFSVSADF